MGVTLCVVTLDGIEYRADTDDFAWFLCDPMPVKRIFIRGAQGLWRPDPHVVAELFAHDLAQ